MLQPARELHTPAHGLSCTVEIVLNRNHPLCPVALQHLHTRSTLPAKKQQWMVCQAIDFEASNQGLAEPSYHGTKVVSRAAHVFFQYGRNALIQHLLAFLVNAESEILVPEGAKIFVEVSAILEYSLTNFYPCLLSGIVFLYKQNLSETKMLMNRSDFTGAFRHCFKSQLHSNFSLPKFGLTQQLMLVKSREGLKPGSNQLSNIRSMWFWVEDFSTRKEIKVAKINRYYQLLRASQPRCSSECKTPTRLWFNVVIEPKS